MRIAAFFIFLFSYAGSQAQTCCSGGVPVSANLGLPKAETKSWQMALTYDQNTLQTLLDGKKILMDDNRERLTRSLLIELGYSISEKWSVDIFFSLVQQVRTISRGIQLDRANTFGPGDLALLFKYQVINKKNFYWSLGLGPKLPTGPSALRDEQGIIYVADLQPGSGALDFLYWSQLSMQTSFRPSFTISMNSIFSQKGTNNDYLGSLDYRFGNEYQISLALSDRLLIKKQLFDPAIALRFRKAFADNINQSLLPNTGGQWIFLEPALTYWINPTLNFSAGLALPIYAEVTGTQLSPTMRWNIGVFKKIVSKKKNSSEIIEFDQL